MDVAWATLITCAAILTACLRGSAIHRLFAALFASVWGCASAQALRSRTDYAEYPHTTSDFVPLPPRRPSRAT